MTVRLRGGSALRARLQNVAEVGPDFAREWADETAKRMRATKPSTHRNPGQFTTKVQGLRAGVYGAFWWIFVDRGRKASDPTRGGPAERLKFVKAGETIFARKGVVAKAVRRRPFISRAAQEALTGSRWAEAVIRRWNGRRIQGPHTRFID